jgi:hypothetical protein
MAPRKPVGKLDGILKASNNSKVVEKGRKVASAADMFLKITTNTAASVHQQRSHRDLRSNLLPMNAAKSLRTLRQIPEHLLAVEFNGMRLKHS